MRWIKEDKYYLKTNYGMGGELFKDELLLEIYSGIQIVEGPIEVNEWKATDVGDKF